MRPTFDTQPELAPVKSRPRRKWALTAGAMVAVAALLGAAGCASEPSETAGPTGSSATSPPASPPSAGDGDTGGDGGSDAGSSDGDAVDGSGASTAPPAVALPSCDVMNVTAAGESDDFYALQGTAGVSAPRGETNLDTFNQYAGPSAQAAMAQALQLRGCTWPVHYHNVVTQYTVELPDAARDDLIAALRASDYVESAIGAALKFDYTIFGDPNAMIVLDIDVTYLFLENVWIAIIGNGQLDYADAALSAVRDANPHLSL